MAMNANPGPSAGGAPQDERLACGRPLFEVWQRREAGRPDPHADRCPYCTAALGNLTRLGDLVRAVDGPEPSESDAAALTERVMDVVRLELRPGRTLPLGGPEEDSWIVEAAAARTFRAAAETVPGVRAGSCRIAPAGPEGLPRAPAEVRLKVQVALAEAWNLPDVAEDVRRAVLAAADAALGMRITAVHVDVTDVGDSGDGNEQNAEGSRDH